jgi:hypothetical protein
MKKIKLLIVGVLIVLSGTTYAQTTSSQPIPLQDSSGTQQDKKFNSSPTPMPKTGSRSEDTLIRDQRGASVSPDSSKYNRKSIRKGKRNGGSGTMDTTGTRRKNN